MSKDLGPRFVLTLTFLALLLLPNPAAAQCTAESFGYEGAIGSAMDSLKAWLDATVKDCCPPYPTVERGKGFLRLSDAERTPLRQPKILRQVELDATQRQRLAEALAKRGQGLQLPGIFSVFDLPKVLSGPATAAKAGLDGLFLLINSLTEARRLSLVQLSGVIKASSGWLQYVAWVWPGEERITKGYFFSRRDGDEWQHFYLGGVNFRLCK